jgi:hypothetical protein
MGQIYEIDREIEKNGYIERDRQRDRKEWIYILKEIDREIENMDSLKEIDTERRIERDRKTET